MLFCDDGAMRVWLLILMLVTVVALAACGGGVERARGRGGRTATPTSAAAPMGPGVSVAQAQRFAGPGPLLVNGFVVAGGDESARLCTGLTDALPPSCRPPSLEVRGLALESLRGLRELGRVRWTPDAVQLLGEVEGDTLTVTSTARA